MNRRGFFGLMAGLPFIRKEKPKVKRETLPSGWMRETQIVDIDLGDGKYAAMHMTYTAPKKESSNA